MAEERTQDFDYEEFDEESMREFDAIVEYIGSLPKSTTYVSNFPRVETMRFSYLAVKKALKEAGCKAKVTCGQSSLTPSMGYIDIEAKSINMGDLKWFRRATEFADNIEVYPKTDGTVQMSMVFYGIMKPAE